MLSKERMSQSLRPHEGIEKKGSFSQPTAPTGPLNPNFETNILLVSLFIVFFSFLIEGHSLLVLFP